MRKERGNFRKSHNEKVAINISLWIYFIFLDAINYMLRRSIRIYLLYYIRKRETLREHLIFYSIYRSRSLSAAAEKKMKTLFCLSWN